jgi:Na+/phosphate symporter
MTVSIIAVVMAVLGALIFALATNPKLSEIGRIMFFCGLLVACLLLGGRSVHIP